MKRTLSVVEIMSVLALVSLLSTSVYQQAEEQGQLVCYRSVLHTLSDAIRTLAWRTPTRHQRVELRIDRRQRSFTMVVVAVNPHSVDTVEETIWLPEGLEILDAPGAITASADGELPPTTIIVAAPVQNRLFRMVTTISGGVQLHEESTL